MSTLPSLPSMDVIAQAKDLQARNADLLKEIQLKDKQIQDLQEVQAHDVQAAKIIELSKKVRALNLAVEKEKQRSTGLLQERGSLTKSSSNGNGGSKDADDVARGLVEHAAGVAEAAQKEAATWKDRATHQMNRMAQVEHKVSTLEAENKKLTRALQREVGEDVPLAKMLEEGGDWKGRREQVIALKDQIRQLKAQQGRLTQTKHETTVKNNISKLTKEKGLEAERLLADVQQLKQEHVSLKLKCDGASSRKKILEGEVSSLKEKLMVVLKKSENDSKLISALKAELSAARERETNTSDVHFGQDELWAEISRLRKRCAEQDEQIGKQAQACASQQTAALRWSGTSASSHSTEGAHNDAPADAEEPPAA